MAQSAKAPAAAKAAPSRERSGQAVAPQRRTAPAVQRVGPRPAACACGGHCPKCARNAPAPVVPTAPVNEDPAAEREAEKIAQLLMGRLSGGTPPSPPDESAGPPVRRRIISTAAPGTGLGAGTPLPSALRDRLEPVLGFDLSSLRLHTGAAAQALAHLHHARALSYGSHIVFGAGEFSLGTARGRHALAHELVHTIQQSPVGAAPRQRPPDHARSAPVVGLGRPPRVAADSIAAVSAPTSAHHPWASGALSHQSHPRGPPRARGPPIAIAHRFTQPRVQRLEWPSWKQVSSTAVNIGTGAVGTAIDLGSSAVDLAVDVGEGAVELGEEVIERTADFFIGLIDEYAPGLLDFLRGGFMGRLTDLFCRGVDAVIGGLISSLENIDFVSVLEETFASAQGSVEGVIGSIRAGASSALGALMQPVVEALDQYGPGIIDAISGASDSVNGFFDSIWESIGAPAMAFLEDAGGAVWQEISDTITWLWDSTASIREVAEDAWEWVMEQFEIAWDSTSGIRDWLSEKAGEAWDAMKEELGPLEGPITTLAAVLLILSPVGPIVIATQVIPPLWEKLTWLWNNWNTNDILVWAQDTLREDILPGVIGLVSGVASAIAGAAAWIAGITVQVASAFSGVLGIFGANACLATVTRVLTAISEQFDRLAAWAEGGFTGLADAVANVFNAIVAILQPILDFLIRLVIVAANPPMLPIAITGAIWMLIPDELKPPVINFVLDLIIAFLRGFPAFLTGLGPLASILKSAALGFLRTVRGQDDSLKIAASNKIANLMAGAGLQFVAGFAVGLLEGIIDGILDPFRLIWMLIQFLARLCRSIGDYLAPLLFEAAPPLGAAVADVNASVRATIPDHPPAHAPPTEAGATAGSSGETHTLTRATSGSIVGPTSSAPPATAASPVGAAPGPSPEDMAMAEIMGAGPTASDAEVVASLSPGLSGQLSGAAGELDAAGAEGESSAVSETRSEGSSVGSLSSLLGGAWTAILDGAHGLGGSIARALIGFIMLPDYQLGNKIGYVAGLILLELIIAYFSGSVSVQLKAAEPFIKAAIRFLDLGGEILGLLGRAVRPIKGPLLRGLSAAGEHLGRFRFLQPLLARIRRAADVLFHFGDEAVDAAGRTGSHADDVGRHADDLPGPGRQADEAADAGDSVADDALKAAQMPAAIAAARAICEANDRLPVSPPPSVVVGQLTASLMPRFRWIDSFGYDLIAPGHFQIYFRASPKHITDPDYSAGATADGTDVTPHERGPDPIVERRPGGSGARPDASGSPNPRPRPDAPEPRDRIPDVDDELDDIADDVADPRRADELADEVGPTSITRMESEAIAREAGIPDEILGDSTVVTRGDMDDVVSDRPLGHGRDAPDPLPLNRPVSRSGPQNIDVQEDMDLLRQAGADPDSFRVNQMQVDMDELRTGTNRPDLSCTINGRRVHIEYDRAPGTRAMDHARRILQNDPDAIVILKIVDFDRPIRRSAAGNAPAQVPASVSAAIRQPGRPLPSPHRERAESFFRTDLRHVRLHDDDAAATAAAESRAHALASGPHILLSRSHRDLTQPAARQTLAHEIAHTLQPSSSPTSPTHFAADSAPAETEARAAGTAFASPNSHAPVSSSGSGALGSVARERDPRADDLAAVIADLPIYLNAIGIAEALETAVPNLNLEDPDNYEPLQILLEESFGEDVTVEVFSAWFNLQEGVTALPATAPPPSPPPTPSPSATSSVSEDDFSISEVDPSEPSAAEVAVESLPRSLSESLDPDTAPEDDLVAELAAIGTWMRAHPDPSDELTLLREAALSIVQALVVRRGRDYFQRYGYLVPESLLPYVYAAMFAGGLANGFLAGIGRTLPPESVEALNAELRDPINAIGFEAGNVAGILWGAGEDLVMNVVGLAEIVGWLAWHAPLPILGLSMADFEDWYDQATDPEGYAAREAAEAQFYRDLFTGLVELHAEFTRDPSVLISHGDALGEAIGEASGRWFTGTFMAMPPHEKGFTIGRIEGMIIMEIALLFLGPEEWIARGVSATAQALRASRLAREILALIDRIPGLQRIIAATRRLNAAREGGAVAHVATETAEALPEAARLTETAVDEGSDLARVGDDVADLSPSTASPPPTIPPSPATATPPPSTVSPPPPPTREPPQLTLHRGTGTAADRSAPTGDLRLVEDADAVPTVPDEVIPDEVVPESAVEAVPEVAAVEDEVRLAAGAESHPPVPLDSTTGSSTTPMASSSSPSGSGGGGGTVIRFPGGRGSGSAPVRVGGGSPPPVSSTPPVSTGPGPTPPTPGSPVSPLTVVTPPPIAREALQTGMGDLTDAGIRHIRDTFETIRDPRDPRRILQIADLTDDELRQIYRQSSTLVEDLILTEMRADWAARPASRTDFLFASPTRTFRGFATELERRARAAGLAVDRTMLDQTTHAFLEAHPALRAEWQRWQTRIADDLAANLAAQSRAGGNASELSSLRRRQTDLESQLDELTAFERGAVGDKRPDAIEVMLSQLEVHITDPTLAYTDPLHNFKSSFYRQVVEDMLGGRVVVTATDYRAPLLATPIAP